MRKIKHGRLAGGCSDACCLKLEGLSVHIQGEDILEDVSFHLHCGEIAALIGPNGAGKSSLFRSILGRCHTPAPSPSPLPAGLPSGCPTGPTLPSPPGGPAPSSAMCPSPPALTGGTR